MDETDQLVKPQITQQPGASSSRNIKMIVITAIITALVSSLVTYFVMSSNQKNSKISYQSPSPTNFIEVTPTKALANLSIVDWKTYENTAYNYSIKYPASWQVGVKGGGDPATFPAPGFSSPCNYSSGDICSSVGIEIGSDDGKLEPTFIIDSRFDTVISKKPTTLDGEPAQEIILLSGNQGEGGSVLSYVLVALHNKTKYEITYDERTKDKEYKTPSDWQDKKIADQMISTFTFNK